MTDTGASPLSTEGAQALLTEIRAALGMYAEDPAYTEAPAYEEPPAYGEPVTPEDVKEVMDYLDVPEEVKDGVYEKWEAGDSYDTGSLINVILEDNTAVNEISQDLDIHGEVHADVHQANEATAVNATGEGANAAGGDQHYVQSQTGDGQQIGGDNSGVANQGDNSGQQAGGEVSNHGDFTSGDGNVSLEGVTIDDSAVGFGAGDTTNTANDTYVSDSYNDESSTSDYTETNTDSFNTTVTEDYDESVNIEAHITDSLNESSSYVEDNDHHDVDDSHNIGDEAYDG